MRLNAVSGIMLTLLLICTLTLAFNIQPVKAGSYYSDFEIRVIPEFPTLYEKINVTVSLIIHHVNSNVTFNPLSQVSNTFFVAVDIHPPHLLLPMTKVETETYHLGELAKGSYSFLANVTVRSEPTVVYSTMFSVTSIPGDVNGDGIVDINDVVIAALAFGSEAEDDPSTPWNETGNWNPDADLNNDGIIDIFDLVTVGVNFGKTL